VRGYPKATGVHLLPASGEYAYDTIPFSGAQRVAAGLGSMNPMNTFYAPGGSKTDYSYAMDQLQAAHPECTTVSVVCAWFFNSEDANACNIYPSTNYLLGAFEEDGVPGAHWLCSGLTEQDYPGIIPLPTLPGTTNFVYGGTPSDPSIVRCMQDLKSRGFRVVFYPFLLGTSDGFPWRGRITYSNDMSSAAAAAVDAFLGSATTGMFTRDPVNLTVSYSGYLYDWTYRRMILHYANLCVLAGGVDLFSLGSELRGLEIIRGPGWTKAGTTDGSGYAVWDYPFIAGLIRLADDVRSVFDGAELTKNLTTLKNLIVYSADWSSWMGWQHPGENGQWPHLDQLWAHDNIDFVSFDNYLPLSDITTGNGGLDVENWSAPAYSGAWPPPSGSLNGLGLLGVPSIYSSAYLKANIEGGQYFDWFYNDGTNDGLGFDPSGSALTVSLPEGDRLAQARKAYSAGQQILASKQLRWWWNNTHQAVYDTGAGWVAQGPRTEWQAQSKSILMLEYGFSAVDKATNQPNVFFDPKSVESFTPFWSIWDPAPGGPFTYLPRTRRHDRGHRARGGLRILEHGHAVEQ
jgi:GTA TIM-barrel-like domain